LNHAANEASFAIPVDAGAGVIGLYEDRPGPLAGTREARKAQGPAWFANRIVPFTITPAGREAVKHAEGKEGKECS